jgi:hypothetical protein
MTSKLEEIYKRQLQELNLKEQSHSLLLSEAVKQNDDYSQAEEMQNIANVRAERKNLVNEYNEEMARQQPRRPEYLTPEERAARPIEKMDWSDAVELARTSRYGRNLKADDPYMIAGWHEARRRRGRGE